MPDQTILSDDIVVRLGTPADIHDIMELAEAVAGENAPAAPSIPKILQGVWGALERKNGLVGVVGPRGGKVQGFVLLKVGPPWYSDERVIEECGVYVHPDWRGARYAAPAHDARTQGRAQGRAAMLYKFCKDVADQMGCKLIIGVMSQHRQASKLRYYERFFGKQAGAFFIYDPRAQAAAE